TCWSAASRCANSSEGSQVEPAHRRLVRQGGELRPLAIPPARHRPALPARVERTRTMHRVRLLAVLLGALGWSSALAADNWPQFRGPDAGVAEGNDLPDTWGATQNVVWASEVPGRGWSSPVVWGDKVFLTSVVTDGKFEDPKKGLYFGGERAKPSTDLHHWMVWCFDFRAGKKLWEKEAYKGTPPTTVHIKNTYASETMVTDG